MDAGRVSLRTVRIHLYLFLAASLVLTGMSAQTAFARQDGVIMNIVIVYGIPGHSAIHLQRGTDQLYWDPGGFYGTEYDDCVNYNSSGACRRFDGFPWEHLKAARRNDVFSGKDADLMQILSIYHLDGDPRSEVYSVTLEGELADRAWRLLDEGQRRGRKADFSTDRQPMFCVKAVIDYLHTLGGDFETVAGHWLPGPLADELRQRGIPLVAHYSIDAPAIQQRIDATRLASGLPPMFSIRKTRAVRHLSGAP